MDELIHSKKWFNTLIPHWPKVGRVTYTVVRWVIDTLSHCV